VRLLRTNRFNARTWFGRLVFFVFHFHAPQLNFTMTVVIFFSVSRCLGMRRRFPPKDRSVGFTPLLYLFSKPAKAPSSCPMITLSFFLLLTCSFAFYTCQFQRSSRRLQLQDSRFSSPFSFLGTYGPIAR